MHDQTTAAGGTPAARRAAALAHGLGGDHAGTALACLLPAGCFVVVAWYGAIGQRLRA